MTDRRASQELTAKAVATNGTEPDHQKGTKPSTGDLVPLATYSFQDPAQLKKTSEWFRLGKPPSRVPSLIRVVDWALSATMKRGSRDRVFTTRSIAITFLKLLVAFPLIIILMFSSEFGWKSKGIYFKLPRFHQYYDAVGPDRNANSPAMENMMRADDTDSDTLGPASDVDPTQVQSSVPHGPSGSSGLRPTGRRQRASALISARHLCVIRDFKNYKYDVIKVEDYIDEQGVDVDLEFVFVSYTQEHFRVSIDDTANGELPDERARMANEELLKSDRDFLTRCGIEAAKREAKNAFWVDFECIRNADEVPGASRGHDDIYRIADAARVARSMIIVIGPQASSKAHARISNQELSEYDPKNNKLWLKEWGLRLWSLPELLLCPNEHRIKVFAFGDSSEPKAMSKRDLASTIWDDAEQVGKLTGHFEGSATLKQPHLIEAALICVSRRDTVQSSEEDVAHLIISLLPYQHRPNLNKGDSGFQALAKLSLADDGGLLLERLMCISSSRPTTSWYNTQDFWEAELSSIEPVSRISGVLESDAVILGRAYGATIQWDDLDSSVPVLDESDTFGRYFTGELSSAFWVLKILLAIGSICRRDVPEGMVPMWPIWAMLAVLTVLMTAVLTPLLCFIIYKVAPRLSKARLIGFEGFVDPGMIEKYLYGFNYGDLTLQSSPGQYHDSQIEHYDSNDGYAFTLVDTYMKTVTHFCAQSPPVAMLICAREGGMLRGLLCSYDGQEDTYTRQAVLRVGSEVLERMHPVDGLKLSMGPRYARSTNKGPEMDQVADLAASARPRTWRVEVAFLCILWMVTRVDMPVLYWNIYDYTNHTSIRFAYYSIPFIVAQLPAYLLLEHVPIQRIFPHIATLKGADQGFGFSFWLSRFEHPALIIFRGALDGVICSIFISYVWSWYKPRELPVRLMAWAVVTRCCYYSLNTIVADAMPFVSSLIFFYLGTAGSAVVGRPLEVPWLSGYEKLVYAVQASAYKLSHAPAIAWCRRNFSWIKYLQYFVVFGVSFSTAITTVRQSVVWNATDEVIVLLITIDIAAILYRFPRATIQTMVLLSAATVPCAVLAIASLPTAAKSVIRIVTRLNALILPLIWATIVRVSSTWPDALRTLACSLMGTALGDCLDYFFGNSTLKIAFSITNLVLICFLWAFIYTESHQPSGDAQTDRLRFPIIEIDAEGGDRD